MAHATPPISPPHGSAHAHELREADVELPEPYGLLAEYDSIDAVMAAAEKVRDAGYRRFDVLAPFPIHGIDEAMGNKMTVLPWIVFFCGLTGCLTGLFITHYTQAIRFAAEWLPESLKGYEYLISGKPFLSTPAYIPPIFELTILFSAFGAVFGMFILNKLPLLSHPLLRSGRIRRATQDRFFIEIEARDKKYDERATAELLRSTGPVLVETVAG